MVARPSRAAALLTFLLLATTGESTMQSWKQRGPLRPCRFAVASPPGASHSARRRQPVAHSTPRSLRKPVAHSTPHSPPAAAGEQLYWYSTFFHPEKPEAGGKQQYSIVSRGRGGARATARLTAGRLGGLACTNHAKKLPH
jgi:hypothetical protein